MLPAILASIGVALAWEVISQSFAAYLGDVAPEMALRINPQQPTALVKAADRMLRFSEEAHRSRDSAATPTPQLNDQVRTWAEAAVMNEPLNARAARILGQFADAAGNDTHAVQFMKAAAHFSPRETYAVYWMMRRDLAAGNYEEAAYYADIMLRSHPELRIHVIPELWKMAEGRQASGPLKALLAGHPPWRSYFFAMLPDRMTDPRIPLDLLLEIRRSSVPPTSSEIDPYLAFLVKRKLFTLAYYAWLQFLPPQRLSSVGLLYNGSFELPSSGGPFDWTITQGSGVTIDVVPRSGRDTEHALLVEFQDGRVDFHAVTQMVMISPGRYKLHGIYKGTISGLRGLKWSVTCADEVASKIGEGEMIRGTQRAWRDFEFSFSVPQSGCPAQYVRLDLDARTASERLVSGSILFDELTISRLDSAPI